MTEIVEFNNVDTQPWQKLANLINEGNPKKLNDFLDAISPSETARSVSHLDEEHRKKLVMLLKPTDAADVLHDLTDEQAADIIEDISPSGAAAIMTKMPNDEQEDILSDISPEDVEAILNAMPKKNAEKTRNLLQYSEDCAGGIMSTSFLSYLESMTVGKA